MLKTRDPLAKLAVGLVAIVLATLSTRIVDLAALSLLLAAMLLLVERMPPRSFLLALLPFTFFAVTSSWIYAVAPSNVYGWTGWQVATAVGLRTITVGLVSLTFAWTTEPADLGRALVHRTRLSRRFVYGTLAAIQFLPGLAEDARMARMTARAAIGPSSRIRRALAGFSPALGITLLSVAIRRASTAALAMELRGLKAEGAASAWRVRRLTRIDLVFAAVAAVVLAAIRLLGDWAG